MARPRALPGLSAETPIKDAAVAILFTRADELVAQLEDLLASQSATAVHGARAAARRLRAALDTLTVGVPGEAVAKPRAQLKKLFQRLGEARDVDIQLALVGGSSPRVKARLERKRARRYDRARSAAKKFLRRGTLSRLRAQLTDALVLRADRLPAEVKDRSLRQGADAILTPLTDELLKRLGKAQHLRDPESFHRLRIAARRERDALEMLAGALPELGGWQRRLAALATVLGELHDLDVLLGHASERLERVGKKTRVELERLIARATVQRSRLLAEAESRLSPAALKRLDAELRNARAGSFFEDPSRRRVGPGAEG